ncbi:MAG: 4Fe-4S binding protein [Anaerolineae bacterium]|jgi:NAD-dependent dihydropyrimidine dehydrogenase PreA subunit|nr:4Fe-4S binding protein [Anaerolineae bacterium]
MNQQQPTPHREPILPRLDRQRCTRCGECVTACPAHVIEMAQGQPVFARPQDCTYCTACEGACPAGAIRCAFTVAWDDPL